MAGNVFRKICANICILESLITLIHCKQKILFNAVNDYKLYVGQKKITVFDFLVEDNKRTNKEQHTYR